MDDVLAYNKQVRGFTLKTNNGIITTMRDFSTTTSSSFGIGATVPVSGVSFGGSYGAKSTFSSMHDSASSSYYSVMHAQATLYWIYVQPGTVLSAVPSLASDIQQITDSRDVDDWKKFINTHGSHYVSGLKYGGTITATNEVTYDSSSSLQSWATSQTETFKLGFSLFLGLDVSHKTSNGQTSEQAQDSWSQSVSLKVHGGDEADALAISSSDKSKGSPVAQWLSSVTNDTAVVIDTQLASIVTLFPADDQAVAKAMVGQLLRSCPGQEKDGDWLACSGVGRCTFTSAAAYCVCPPGLVGAACNVTHIACSPACEHGVCDYGTGKCKCHPNYMGADCSTTCGTKRFPYVPTNWVSIGGHTGSYNDDNPTADTSARSEALDCICKKEMPSWARSTTGGYWGQGTLNYVDTSGTHDSTYPCINSG